MQRHLFTQLYVDLDDVLAETMRTLVALLHSTWGRTVAFDRVFSFDLMRSFSLSKTQHREFLELAHRPEILRSIHPMQGAREGLTRFHSRGVRVVIVTGRPTYTYDVTYEWLVSHKMPFDALYFVDKYPANTAHVVSERRALSLRALAALPCAAAVEDSPKMAKFLAGRLAIPVAMLERPWNRGMPGLNRGTSRNIDRCSNWRAVSERLHALLLRDPAIPYRAITSAHENCIS